VRRIHKLLHWWIGLKACNVILARERLDRERRKKAENRQARVEAEHANHHGGEAPASFVALAPNSVLHDVDTGSRGSPMSSSAMLTPPESGESPIVGPREGAAFAAINGGDGSHGAGAFAAVHAHAPHNGQHQSFADGVWSRLGPGDRSASRGNNPSWPATNAQPVDSKAAGQALAEQAAAERQITENVAQLVAGFRLGDGGPEKVPLSSISIPYRGLDYDSLRALRSYIYNEEGGVQVDEDVLLNRLERIWRELVRADSQKMLVNVQSFIARERALLTWIELRRHMAAFERAERRRLLSTCCKVTMLTTTGWANEGTSNAELERRHQQYCTLMGATETILINFEDVGQGFGVAPGQAPDRDELLRQAIVVLAGEKYAVEMQWKSIDFSAAVQWLGEHLSAWRKDEEEEGRSTMWYVG
jgi:hypothetical protein